MVSLFLVVSRAECAVPRPTCSTSECHTDIKKISKPHGPVKAKGCTVCHVIGTGTKSLPAGHPGLMPTQPGKIRETCVVCHDDKASTLLPVTHAPVTEKDCTECHNPHGSDKQGYLKNKSISELCFSCHKELRSQPHGGHATALLENKSCLSCHDSHFSKNKKLLRGSQNTLCLRCHNKEINTKSASLVNLEKFLANHPVTHKPVQEGKCHQCHNPHGSNARKFLIRKYEGKDFSLCLECHHEPTFTSSYSERTGFRNGSTNLHYFHLQPENKSTCRTCHEVHASKQDRLITDNFDYHGWFVPIQYTKTPTGGTCMGACHGEKKYDRNHPVQNPKGK